MKRETLLAHSGTAGKEYGGIVNLPPHRASTILFDNLEDFQRADCGDWPTPTYARYGNPSTMALEETIAKIAGAEQAIVFSSGLAAIINAILTYCETGDHMLMVDTTYGCTRRYCDQQLGKLGIDVTYYDPTIGAGIEAHIKPNTKVVFCESPGSLTFEMQDIPAIAEAAHKHGAKVIADCTWAGPLYFDAQAKGVDVVMYSATKYMSGHSDVVMGVLCCKEDEHKALLRTARNMGACASADDAYLVMRGMKTIQLRMEKQMQNALEMATWLNERPEVERVMCPLLPSDPGHELWKRDFTGGASLFSFLLKPCSDEGLAAMFDGLTKFGMGYSWGGFESLLITYNAKKIRTARPWTHDGPNVRIHVGLEHTDDLKADLEAGFKRLKG